MRPAFNLSSSVCLESATVDAAFHASRMELRGLVFHHPDLFPRDEHGEKYHRAMVCEGTPKPLHLRCYLGFLLRIYRKHGAVGREMVRRILNPILGLFGFHAADVETPDLPLDSLDVELLEAHVAHSSFVTLAQDFKNLRDPATRRAAKRAGDRVKTEITEAQAALDRESA